MPLAKRRQARTPRTKVKPRPAFEALVSKFDELIEEQAGKMTDAEFKAAEKDFNRVIERVRASQSGQHDND